MLLNPTMLFATLPKGATKELRFATILHIDAPGLSVRFPSDVGYELQPDAKNGGACLCMGTENLEFDANGVLLRNAWVLSIDGKQVGLCRGMSLVTVTSRTLGRRTWKRSKEV